MDFHAQAVAARAASLDIALLTRAQKDAALHAMADALSQAEPQLLTANAHDVAEARRAGTAESIIDRLALNSQRIASMAQGLRNVAALPDPVGDVVRGWRLPDGVKITQVRVPFGVIGIIYEARPNVTADAVGLCLKSGNAAVLRGSSSALNTNKVIIDALRQGLATANITPDAVCLVEGGREVTSQMMRARGLIDVLIPRGGAGLIQAVVEGSTVPVIETGTGNCHIFVDVDADLDVALGILINAKTQRPSVCNAVETLLVHRSIAEKFMPMMLEAMDARGVTIHGDQETQAFSPAVVAARADEYQAEYLTLDLAVKVVADLDEALSHIRRYSTGHSETIVTENKATAERFLAQVDAAAVLVNASSRFVDGGEFGFGAEIGISTQKLHARGPMGLAELTSTKYLIEGTGQVRL